MELYENLTVDVLSSSFSFVTDLYEYEASISKSYIPKRLTHFQHDFNSPLGCWLNQLRGTIESESLSTLQAKSVAVDPESFEALSIRNAQISIYKIRCNSVDIIDDLDFLIDRVPISTEQLTEFHNGFQNACHKICEIIELCRRRGCDYISGQSGKVSSSVSLICQQMIKFIKCFEVKKSVNNAQLEATLRKLKERLGELVDLTTRRDAQVISNSLRNTKSHLCMKWSLLALWQLTQNDAYISRVFTETNLVLRHLIDISCHNNTKSFPPIPTHLKSAALRVLSHLCINRDGLLTICKLLDFENDLIRLLIYEKNENLLQEATGLIVQISTPFIDYRKNANKDNVLFDYISRIPIPALVHALTHVASITNCREVFLLTTAALANISFLEMDAFIRWETVHILILKIKQKSILNDTAVKDQVTTVIANLSSAFPMEILNCALNFLLQVFQLRPYNTDNCNEACAIERIQQKIATALARLGSHKNIAIFIHRLNGVQRLVELCKEPKERNYSDTVLLACLAALRRISHVIGRGPFQQMKCLDLIDLDFRDSFVIYSSKNESYV